MATASPTPMGGYSTLGRRTSARQALRRPPSRPQLSRSESNPVANPFSTSEAPKQPLKSRQFSNLHDSSDDEIPVPMKLSALTKALLDDGGSSTTAGPPITDQSAPAPVTRKRSVLGRSTSAAPEGWGKDSDVSRETRRHARAGSGQLTSSPSRPGEPSSAPRKRVVRLSSSNVNTNLNTTPGGSTLQARTRRSSSTHKRPPSRDATDDNKIHGSVPKPEPQAVIDPEHVINTPATGARRVRIVTGSSGTHGRSSVSILRSSPVSAGVSKPAFSGSLADRAQPEEPQTAPRTRSSVDQGADRAKSIKRIGFVPGSFLSGPARRGRRRQSEEENSPVDEQHDENNNILTGQEPDSILRQHVEPAASSFYSTSYRDLAAASGSPVGGKDSARAALRTKPSAMALSSANDAVQNKENIPPGGSSEPAGAPPVLIPSARDQENDIVRAPSRPKDIGSIPFQEKLKSNPVEIPRGAAGSPERKALSQMSRNTPLRPAPPPPPKMSVLDAVTSTAGAATTAHASKKQRVLLKVNGRAYNRLDCIGRGGSAKVYRVTAENGKMFALKRVSLEHADAAAINGFLGEIELLKRLSGVDRVIQMYDSELNQEKKLLSVLMEMGELDLGDLLKSRHIQEDYKLDTVFVRFVWKEMLECLRAVHSCDIVHSDLKPANFVLVKGRLKLIDFGIAGAIQTDETVNVHRENQIGTPSYMSPESLMDSTHYAATAANNGRPDRSLGRTRLMKIGKPSDIWSLGCILYQLVYGLPPFGHIPNQLARCQAIIAWDHKINFPDKGAGGVPVPPSLVRTMKKCLVRDQQYRPTCEELLSDTDAFLYPQEVDMERVLPMTEELLVRVVHSVVARCRERMPTEGEALTTLPNAYWASLKRNLSNDARP